MSLKEKNALITGSSRGIGRGIALKLAESGANVAVHYFQNEAAAKQTLAMIHDRGSQGFILQADTTKPDEIGRMIKKVHADFGALDIFVSNARPEVGAFFQPGALPPAFYRLYLRSLSLREVVMVNGERERPARGHIPEDPSAGDSSHGPGQKRISSDRPVIQVEVADVVAFEVQPSVVAIDMDLDLE